MKMSEEQAKELRNDILKNNKILYCMHSRPMTETCMCWGLEVPNAWLNDIDEMSAKLEGANFIAYPMYRTRIQMDQVKIKYATLHAYFDVVCDPPAWICAYENLVDKLMRCLNKIDYKFKTVVDKDSYDEVVIKEIPKEKYEEELEDSKHISNVEVYIDENEKRIKKITYHHYKQTHQEPTKHKFLYRIFKRRYAYKSFLRNILKWEPSHVQQCIANVLRDYATCVVNKTKEECTHYCEQCGTRIYDDGDYNPRCTTLGWIRYLCKECADKDGSRYACRGEVWQNGMLMTKNKTREHCEC